jgi:hypothetical protein
MDNSRTSKALKKEWASALPNYFPPKAHNFIDLIYNLDAHIVVGSPPIESSNILQFLAR